MNHVDSNLAKDAFIQVLLVKLLPNFFSDKTKQDVCRVITVNEEWLSDVIRKVSPNKVQKCLKQYNYAENIPISCFDYPGINVWSIIMEIGDHIFNNCNQQHANSVPITPDFSVDMRHRSKICLLAFNHRNCPSIQRLTRKIAALADNNLVIYKTIAHAFEQYQPKGTLPPLEPNQALSDWWYHLARDTMCLTFPIDHYLLLLAYIYKLMGDEKLAYHFQYANTLERLSLANGAKTDFNNPNKSTITYGPLEINVSHTLPTLPDEPWMYVDGNYSVKSQGMVTAFYHFDNFDRRGIALEFSQS